MSKAQQARQLFENGANCAQAVLGAFSSECGITQEMAMKLASGFGGGLGRMREVCGAVSGMCMAADLLWGFSDSDDKACKDEHYALIQKLAGEFKEEIGSIVCRELLGLDRGENASPVSTPRTKEFYRKRPCSEMVALAAAILDKEINTRK